MMVHAVPWTLLLARRVDVVDDSTSPYELQASANRKASYYYS